MRVTAGTQPIESKSSKPTERALVSWSGGKDCCLALWRARRDYDIVGLVCMMTEDGTRSRSHGIGPEVLRSQAAALDLPLLTASAGWHNYEAQFAQLLLASSRELGARHVIFGDIFPESHRHWAERMCAGCDLIAVEPLWGEDTSSLVREFIAQEGRALIVTVRDGILGDSWLGRSIDHAAVEELVALGVDPCGERGEYHSLVTHFPGFRHSLDLKRIGIARHGGCSLLDLKCEISVSDTSDTIELMRSTSTASC
jgi:diphthine-ammonia ligase